MLIEKFTKEINKIADFKCKSKIAVGVSGGVDSVSLLYLLWEYAQSVGGIEVYALTVNHNLRDESAKEARYVKCLVNNIGVQHHILNWEHTAQVSSNIQSQAREARFNLLSKWCKENGVDSLCLGHTKDDVAETFMIRMLRGSGIQGLSRMESKVCHNGVSVLRPFLDFRKSELIKYLSARNVRWVEDPSNDNEEFLRVKVRKFILSDAAHELFQGADPVDRLCLNASNLYRAKQVIDSQFELAQSNLIESHQEGYITIEYDGFCDLDDEISMRMISESLVSVSGQHSYKPRLNSVINVHAKLMSGSKKASTLCGCEIKLRKKDSKIYIYREIPKNGFKLDKHADLLWMWDNRFEIKFANHAVLEKVEKISAFKDSRVKIADNKKFKRIPKKIWQSTPIVVLTNVVDVMPFFEDKELDNLGIRIKFISHMS